VWPDCWRLLLLRQDSVQGLQFEKRVAPHPNAGAAEGIPDTIEYFECTNAQSQGETVEVEEFNIPDVDGQQFFEFAMEVRCLFVISASAFFVASMRMFLTSFSECVSYSVSRIRAGVRTLMLASRRSSLAFVLH